MLNLGTAFIISLACLFIIVILYILGIFYPPIFDFLSESHVYELIIIAILVEILYVTLSMSRKDLPFDVYTRENDFYSELLNKIKRDRPESVHIMSAGLSSRYQFIMNLLELHVPLRILIQVEDIAIDKTDAKRVYSFLDVITRTLPALADKYLEVRAMKNIVSMRAIIVNYRKVSDTKLTLSWYTYDYQNKVLGHYNPSLILNGISSKTEFLYEFAIQEFNKCWEIAKDRVIFPSKHITSP